MGEPSPIQQYLKASQVAELLNMTTSNVYKQIESGVLPSVRIGHSVRVPARALMDMLEIEPAVHNPPPPPLTVNGGAALPALLAEIAGDPDRARQTFLETTGLEPIEYLRRWGLGELEDDERTTTYAKAAVNIRFGSATDRSPVS